MAKRTPPKMFKWLGPGVMYAGPRTVKIGDDFRGDMLASKVLAEFEKVGSVEALVKAAEMPAETMNDNNKTKTRGK